MGIRLMIIKLRKYNEIGELIENRTTGLQVHVSYWDRVWEASVTRVTICMGVKETGMQTGNRGAQLASELGSRTGMHTSTVEQSEKY